MRTILYAPTALASKSQTQPSVVSALRQSAHSTVNHRYNPHNTYRRRGTWVAGTTRQARQ
jgi:hypothetical protein